MAVTFYFQPIIRPIFGFPLPHSLQSKIEPHSPLGLDEPASQSDLYAAAILTI
jgi:hypothetical protein